MRRFGTLIINSTLSLISTSHSLQSNPDANFRGIVFEGQFLDPAVSAVYGVFFFFGTFAMGALRAHTPKLGILAIFATIVLDVMCSYGPLFPTAQYKLVVSSHLIFHTLSGEARAARLIPLFIFVPVDHLPPPDLVLRRHRAGVNRAHIS